MLALLPAYSAQIFASAANDPGLKDVFASKGEGFGPKRLRLGNTSMKNAKYKKNDGAVHTQRAVSSTLQSAAGERMTENDESVESEKTARRHEGRCENWRERLCKER